MNCFVFSILLFLCVSQLSAQTVRVATVNAWSGLDYQGVACVGEYESDSVRSLRRNHLLEELKGIQPDIVFLQECNPVDAVSSFFAGGLGYDYIDLRVNGGFKIGPLGFPTNLNEGLVILAKPNLGLSFFDVWDLSPRFGAFGDVFSFHLEDQNVALVGIVHVEGTPVAVVNLHLSSAVPDDTLTQAMLARILGEESADPKTGKSVLDDLSELARQRPAEIVRLVSNLNQKLAGIPTVVGGDFNATPDAPEMHALAPTLFNVSPHALITWDPGHNHNIAFSTKIVDASDAMRILESSYDTLPRQIDHIFLGGGFVPSDVQSVNLFANTPRSGLYPSDHYGVVAEIDCSTIRASTPGRAEPGPAFEALPILTYDSDVGFGYGAKGFLLNVLGESESFDVVLFNSTKGERWYRIVFSIPDFELRQGTRYPLSFDFVIDYDKYLKNNFFGVGGNSQKHQGETYTKEPLEIQLVASRGFTERIVGQVGMRFKAVRNSGYDPEGIFAATLPLINHGYSQGLSWFGSVRFDSRNSYVNPSRGNVVQLDLEKGTGFLSDYAVVASSIFFQTYQTLFYPKTVLAARLMIQTVGGSDLPVHVLPNLGGNRTLRGYPQDRFLDRITVVSNLEVRFPILWRFGGVFFHDAGQIVSRWAGLRLGSGWKVNGGVGLRLNMETFVVRADLGLSPEGSGFYFNFGHLF